MARKTDDRHKPELLIAITERYYSEKEPVKRPKYSELGKFARYLGYDIGNHIFQKSPEVRAYLDNREIKDEDKIKLSVAVYDTLDTEKFVKVNNTPSKLKKALQERDAYYRDVTISAGKIFDKNNELQEKNARTQEENQRLMTENTELSGNVAELRKELNILKAKEKRLRELIDTWVTPEIANELLKKEGLLKETAGIVDPNALEEKTVTGSSDIQGLVKSMFKQVDTIG